MSIRALNWATQIYVGDAMAKSLLRAIADYADETGAGFPSLSRLADDCDMSIDSVRRRIRFLEELGLIVVFPCWMDEHGKRNYEKRGRQTSSDIKLLLDVVRTRTTVAQQEDNAPKETVEGESPLANSKGGLAIGEGSSLPGAGLQSARGGVALVLPPNEPPFNQDSPPNPPPLGDVPVDDASKQASVCESSTSSAKLDEPEHFDAFFTACHGWRTMQRGRALAVFRTLTVEEQTRAHAASPLHAAELEKHKRRSLDAHKLLTDRFWEKYPQARLPEKPPDPVWFDSARLDGLRVALKILDAPMPVLIERNGRMGQFRTRPIGPDLDAMVCFKHQKHDAWTIIDQAMQPKEYTAWAKRLHEWTGLRVEPQKYFLEPPSEMTLLPPSHPQFKIRKAKWGLRVPCPWPPSRDGKIYFNHAVEPVEPHKALANIAKQNHQIEKALS